MNLARTTKNILAVSIGQLDANEREARGRRITSVSEDDNKMKKKENSRAGGRKAV